MTTQAPAASTVERIHAAKSLDAIFTEGCGACRNSGYRGRAAIHELLGGTDRIKQLIQTRTRVAEMLVAAKREDMTTLVQDGVLTTLAGITDFRQVKAVAIK